MGLLSCSFARCTYQAMFEKKAATFAQRQRQEEEFALHASRDSAGASAGARGATAGRPLSRRVPRRAASGGAPPYSPLKSSASRTGAGVSSAQSKRPLRAASSPETGVSYQPPESDKLAPLVKASGGGGDGSGGGGGNIGGRGDGLGRESNGAVERDQPTLPAVGELSGSAGGAEKKGSSASSSAGDMSGPVAAAATEVVAAAAAAAVATVASIASGTSAAAAAATIVADGEKPDAAKDTLSTPAIQVAATSSTEEMTRTGSGLAVLSERRHTSGGVAVLKPKDTMAGATVSPAVVAGMRRKSTSALKRGATPALALALALAREKQRQAASEPGPKLEPAAGPEPEAEIGAASLAEGGARGRGEKLPERSNEYPTKIKNPSKEEAKEDAEDEKEGGEKEGGEGATQEKKEEEAIHDAPRDAEASDRVAGEARRERADPAAAGVPETREGEVNVVGSDTGDKSRASATVKAGLPGGGDVGAEADASVSGEEARGGVDVGEVGEGMAASTTAVATAATEAAAATERKDDAEAVGGEGTRGVPTEGEVQVESVGGEGEHARSTVPESAGQSPYLTGVDKYSVDGGRIPSTSARYGVLELDAPETVSGGMDGDAVAGGGGGTTSPPGGRTGESGTSATLTKEEVAAAVAAATVSAAVAEAVSTASAPAAAATVTARTSRVSRQEPAEVLASVLPPLAPPAPMAAAAAMDVGAGVTGEREDLRAAAVAATAAAGLGDVAAVTEEEAMDVPDILISQPLLTSPSLRDCAWSGATASTGSPPAMMAKLAYHHHVESPAVESAFDVASDIGSDGTGADVESGSSFHSDNNKDIADSHNKNCGGDGNGRGWKEDGDESSSATAEPVSPGVMTAVAAAMTAARKVTVSVSTSVVSAVASPRARAASTRAATTTAAAVATRRRRAVSDEGVGRVSEGSDCFMTPMFSSCSLYSARKRQATMPAL